MIQQPYGFKILAGSISTPSPPPPPAGHYRPEEGAAVEVRNRPSPRREYLRYSPPPPDVRRRQHAHVEPSFREPSTRTPYNADWSGKAYHTAPNSDFYDIIFDNRGEQFSITLRDYPYRVVTAPFTSKLESFEFPLLPILQFRTWHTTLYVKAATAFTSEKNESVGKDQREDIDQGQIRCHVADEAGNWVGSIVLDVRWMARQTSHHRYEFIAISDVKDFTQAECETWTYYIPKERKSSEWDLFCVLLD